MPCARMGRVLAAVILFMAPFVPAFGQEWQAVGCGLPAVYEGIDVRQVCSSLGINYESTYGPDRSPWIQIASASDCDRVRDEIGRILAGAAVPGGEVAQPPGHGEPPPDDAEQRPARRETPLEKWLRENGYSSMAEAEADRSATEKKWRQERESKDRFDRLAFEGRMRLLEQELRQRLARQEALVAAELERKRQAAQAGGTETDVIPVEAWTEPLAKWRAELEKANREVEATRQALLKLVRAQEADVKLFHEWENEAQQGFERSRKAIFDLAIDAGMGMFLQGADGWAAYAEGPGAKASPEALEEYRRLFSLIDRLKEAKAARDFASFAASEGKTEAEMLETIRDGILQLSGLLGVEETFPGKVLKYGALFWDQAYHFTALYQVWHNAGVLEQDSAAMSDAVQRLSERLHRQMERQRELVRRIEAGEKIDFN